MPQTTTLDNQIVFKRDYRSGANWTLVSQTEFDGLGRSQIVRVMDAPDRGFGETETHSKLARRLDATADADNFETNGAGATVDAHRYVVDPLVERHQYPGLFTGGPARHGKDQSGKKILTQTLTRTFCAGHGFTVDGHGRFVYSTDPTSHGYATVEDALAEHRATVKRSFSVRMAYRSDIPGFYRTELIWRDFTHESLPFLNGDEGKAAVVAAAERQFGEDLGKVLGVSTQIDPETNTVVVTAAALLKRLYEPTCAADLLAMPRLEGPCSRETLREFGWNDLADGEGYRFIHLYKWFDIKDTPAVRHFFEFGVRDKEVLVGAYARPLPGGETETVYGLLRNEELADSPTLAEETADAENGRFVYKVGGKDHAWWRVLKTAVQPDEQDGTLVFTMACMKPRWFGKVDDDHRVDAGVENPQGIGEGHRAVYPSVPRDNAAEEVKKLGPLTTDEGKKFLVGAVQRAEGEAGREDISVQRSRVFTWKGDDKPELTQKLDGVEGSAVQHTTTAKREEWDVTFDRLDGGAMAELIQTITEQLVPDPEQGRITVKGCQQLTDGAYRLTIHAQGVKKIEFAAWLYTGTYFHEIWRELHFNFKESDLTEGGLDGVDIVTSDRSLNDDGTWDETISRTKPSEPRHLVFRAKHEKHGAPIEHDWFRNERELPQGLKDGTVSGSASYNEHGLIDGQTAGIDECDPVATTVSEDHFHEERSVQETDETSRINEAGVQPGKIVSVREVANCDETFTHTVTEDIAKKCDHVHFTTTVGDRHHKRVLTHHRYVNAPEMAPELQQEAEGAHRVEGSDQHNRYGLHDGNVTKWDAELEDDKAKSKSEDHFSKTESDMDVREESRLSEAGGGENGSPLVSVKETEFPDGFIQSTKTVETPKKCDHVHFTTTVGSLRRKRVVSHHVWTNAPDMDPALKSGAQGATRVEGSDRHNKFGLHDGSVSIYDATNEEGSGRSVSEDHFSRTESETETGENSRIGEASFETGSITTVRETENDGQFTSTVTKETAKECGDVSFQTKEGSLHNPRTVTHRVFINAKEPPAALQEAPDGKKRVSGSMRHNKFGLLDGSVSEWTAEEDENRRVEDSEDRFAADRKETGTGKNAPTPKSYRDGTVVSNTTVTFSDGTQTVSAGESNAKEASWDYNYLVRNGDKEGTVRVFKVRNHRLKPVFDPPEEDETLHVDLEINKYGLWNATATYSPNWRAKRKNDGSDETKTCVRYRIEHLGHARGNFSAKLGPGSAAHAPAFAPARDGYWRVRRVEQCWGLADTIEDAAEAAGKAFGKAGAAPTFEQVGGKIVWRVEGCDACGPVYNGPIPSGLGSSGEGAAGLWETYFRG